MHHSEADFDVIIPCAGSGEYVEETVLSVLSQTLQPKTIWMIDNACTHDYYEKIASKYAGRGVIYRKFEQRLPLVSNWQRCLQLSETQWVAFIHDDDVWSPQYLKHISEKISSNPKANIVLTRHMHYQDGSDPFKLDPENDSILKIVRQQCDDKTLCSFLLASSNAAHMSSTVFRRGFIGFAPYSDWMPDQEILAFHLAFHDYEIVEKCNVGIRISRQQLTHVFKGMGVNSIETLQHIKWVTAYWIKRFGITPQAVGLSAEPLGGGYMLRLLQACHSWPINPNTYCFGRELLKVDKVRTILGQQRKTRVLSVMPSIIWVLAGIVADFKYLIMDIQAQSKKAKLGKVKNNELH